MRRLKRSPGYYLTVVPKKTYPPPQKGRCWTCFDPLPPGQRRYCDCACRIQHYEDTHTKEYVTWAQVRRDVFERDNYTCRGGCNKGKTRYGQLEAHHIIPIYKGGDEFDMDNLITLCIDCHNKTKKRKPKPAPEPVDATAVSCFFRGHRQKTLKGFQ